MIGYKDGLEISSLKDWIANPDYRWLSLLIEFWVVKEVWFTTKADFEIRSLGNRIANTDCWKY